jgi:hypothetical protein
MVVMASGSKPTGIHFLSIFFGMGFLVCLVLAVMFYRKGSELEAKATDAAAKESKASGDLQTASQDLSQAMQLLGGPQTQATENREVMRQQLATLGAGQAKQTVEATLVAMRTALDEANTEINKLKADGQALADTNRQLEANYQNRVDKHDDEAKTSEAGHRKARAEMDEKIQQRDQEIARVKEEVNRRDIELEQLRESSAKKEKDLTAELTTLRLIVDTQKERLENLMKESFERADGEIISIDANLKLVTINLGREDNLRQQVSFSVYSHDHRGLGREAADIKARIEVTRILGPHQAEARILEQDIRRPINEGDPIYSPAWAGGREERFAFVGLIDFDNDGRSDRDTLHRLLKTAGAGIDLEVNDDGVREPSDAKISVNTKFLVLGKIPDPSTFANGDERRAKAEKMMAEQNTLRNEARTNGVRDIKLEDFLAYMGFKPQQRFFQPGYSQQYNLKQGSRTPSIRNDDIQAGQTSKLYRLPKAESTEDAFRK